MDTDPSDTGEVWIETVEIQNGQPRPINDKRKLAQRISDRQADIEAAIKSVSDIIRSSLPQPATAHEKSAGWSVDSLEANVAISLNFETGALIARASTGGTIGLKLTYKRS